MTAPHSTSNTATAKPNKRRGSGDGSWLGHRSPLTVVLAIITVLGVGWFGLNLGTDDTPAVEGDRFADIDAWVADQIDDARIPGGSPAGSADSTVSAQSPKAKTKPSTKWSPTWPPSN